MIDILSNEGVLLNYLNTLVCPFKGALVGLPRSYIRVFASEHPF